MKSAFSLVIANVLFHLRTSIWGSVINYYPIDRDFSKIPAIVLVTHDHMCRATVKVGIFNAKTLAFTHYLTIMMKCALLEFPHETISFHKHLTKWVVSSFHHFARLMNTTIFIRTFWVRVYASMQVHLLQ